MRRAQAVLLIDEIRGLAAKEASGTAIRLSEMLERYGVPPLTVCTGEAHSNAFIDNCMACAPRWGFVGKAVRIT
jgi:hypothetical protein